MLPSAPAALGLRFFLAGLEFLPLLRHPCMLLYGAYVREVLRTSGYLLGSHQMRAAYKVRAEACGGIDLNHLLGSPRLLERHPGYIAQDVDHNRGTPIR